MPGIVAMRMPRRVASRRASVWLKENVVGAKITVASAIAEQISNGGSSPWRAAAVERQDPHAARP